MALLRQAEMNPNAGNAAELRIQAAGLFNAQGQHAQALVALAPVVQSQLPVALADQWRREQAAAHMGLGHPSDAASALTNLSRWQPQDFYLLGQICNAQGDYRCSADGYIQASIELGMDSELLPADIHDRIWLALNRARTAPSAYTHRYHHGWWLLQEQIRTAGSITNQITAWQNWQNRYPSHPARLRPPEALRKLDNYQTPQIGVLLPLSGTYGGAGRAVRDGVVAAYLGEQSQQKPQIRFYDTGDAAIASLYEQALREGADVLVGPLIKSEVESYAALTEYADIPRLVLNYITPFGPNPTPLDPAVYTPPDNPVFTTDNADFLPPQPQRVAAPLFQIGIAIEDEALSLANHVLLNGAENILVIHNQERWAQRALAAYIDSWPYAVTTASFTDIKGLTEAVGEAMQVAASETRKNEIAGILGQTLEFLPRARGDLDAVIALINHVEARALVPALRFHFAGNLPVYATSQVVRGENTTNLAGFELTEMPMFANPTNAQLQLIDAFDLSQNPLGELYALGFDAYRVATWLPILDPESQVALPAASGYLWLETGGKFRRDLNVSRVNKSGALTPLN
jgi:uncharacterized protein